MKSILITGCSSGIGLCVAQGLQARGYHVFASARKAEDVTKLQAQGFEAIQLDLTDSQSIASAVSWVLEKNGGTLDALFNNGGYGQPGAIEDLSRDALRLQFETIVFGWMELTNLLIPVMRKQGHGRIIQNSSVLGLVALPYRGAYVGAKFALEGLTDTLRMELKNTGIFVSLIEPGPIESRFRENAHKMFKRFIPLESSPHRAHYEAMEARLMKKGPAAPFTLPAEAVLAKVMHALTSKRPQPRYYVTFPTYLFGMLRRFLSTHGIDRLMLRVSGNGKR